MASVLQLVGAFVMRRSWTVILDESFLSQCGVLMSFPWLIDEVVVVLQSRTGGIRTSPFRGSPIQGWHNGVRLVFVDGSFLCEHGVPMSFP
ncbi:hypothetical protein H6P81_006048 [Aristolochia fimbriata]|uniref:Secreted protein n=1 Tax=Aristolochia fimbriata TaxID=158543 RepID=A0AAV7EXL8_ARIFI|nr:hypothetical protein H6P81_006048 [Aristolochia fimbriata]